ncbi:MAG: PLP-dependent aminotransferase family protein [Clostridium sp.]
MKIEINKEIGIPIYSQIFQQIRQQILSGELIPGYRLPSERKLAEKLGVNRTTILNAYRELKADGFIGSKIGDGTVVLASFDDESSIDDEVYQEPIWNQVFSEYSSKFDSYVIKGLMELASKKDVISFATGIPSPETGPTQALEGIERELLEKKNHRALMYSPTEGFKSLRKVISNLMNKRGVYCSCDEIMMLSGSQQGIDLAARTLLDYGDIVVVEEPSFFPAIQSFKAVGARVIGVPVDENGMKIDVLEELLQRYKPKFIYTIPTFQNPTGFEMDIERRKKLIELAYKHRVIIIEDDAYGDLGYEGKSLPLLKSMDTNGSVIYLSTFSKNIFSGLRLGWMVAHKRVIKEFATAKQIVDLHSSSLSQWIVERFIESGEFEDHIKNICKEYKFRRDLMDSSLLKYAPAGLKWRKPRGGYYIWCKLPKGVSASRLIVKCAEYNVAFVPGRTFSTSGDGDEFIRLNFTFVNVDKIDEGIKRLCRAMKEQIISVCEYESDIEGEINPII